MNTEMHRVVGTQQGLITRDQAFKAGLTKEEIRGLVRSHGWTRVYPGVLRAPAFPVTWRQNLTALHLWAGGDRRLAVSHRAAAALHQFCGFSEGPLEATTWKAPKSLPADVVIHRAPPEKTGIIHVDGIPVMNKLFTLLVLGAVADRALVMSALDQAVGDRQVSVKALRHTLRAYGRRHRGSQVLAEILAERGEYAVAPNNQLEAAFLALLVAAGLPEPERQVEIIDGEGLIGFVDFVYLAFRLIIELDGYGSHGSRESFQADRERDRRLVAAGWRIVRFTWADIHEHPERVVAELRRLLAQLAGTR